MKSAAETSIIMPTVAKRTKTGNSNFMIPARSRKPNDMTSAAAVPPRIIILARRANASETKAPSKSSAAPLGCPTIRMTHATRRPMASQPTLAAFKSVSFWNAPTINSAIAPSASTISGRAAA